MNTTTHTHIIKIETITYRWMKPDVTVERGGLTPSKQYDNVTHASLKRAQSAQLALTGVKQPELALLFPRVLAGIE